MLSYPLWQMECGPLLALNHSTICTLIASFQQLSAKFGIPKTTYFRYLQVRSFVRSASYQIPSQPADHPMDTFLLPLPLPKGIISCGYERIFSLRCSSLSAVKAAWEQDMGEEISDDLWEDILSQVHSSSMCATHGLIQCKILHHIHWTKLRHLPGC